MLKIRNLKSYYGSLRALKGVSLHIEKNEIVALIGANGAGKSTLLHSIVGLIPRKEGEIYFGQQDIIQCSPREIVIRGISLIPEGRQLFSSMTVRDNLILGAYQRYRKEDRGKIREDLEEVLERFPILRKREKQMAGTLSGGEQQMLAIGRALMSRPRLLLLDEPSLGLAPLIAAEIFRIISHLCQEETTVFLVEQNVRAALKVADRAYVIETGRIVLEGTPEELLGNKEIKRAYLGKGYREIWE